MFLFNSKTLAVLLAIPTGILLDLCEKYIFGDWQYVQALAVLVFFDTLTGFAKDIKLKQFESNAIGKLFIKIIMYGVMIIAANALNYKVQGEPNSFFTWFDDAIYAFMALREAVSLLENVSAINPKLVPAGILKYLKQFQEDGRTLIKPNQSKDE